METKSVEHSLREEIDALRGLICSLYSSSSDAVQVRFIAKVLEKANAIRDARESGNA